MRDEEGELTEETEKAIKEALKNLRKKKGMTTEELLKKLGIKPGKKTYKP